MTICISANSMSVELYGWFHFVARSEASCLYVDAAACPRPPEADMTKGVKDECSTFIILCS